MRPDDRPLVLTGAGLMFLCAGIYLGSTLDEDAQSWLRDVGPVVVGMFGVLAAVGAGMAAWKAAQRQIAASEQLARRHEVEARDTFAGELSAILGMVDLAWNKVEQAINAETVEQRATIFFALFNLRFHFDEIVEKGLPDLGNLAPEMNLRDRRGAITILQQVRAFSEMLNRESDRFDEDHNAGRPPDMMRAHFVLLALSHLHEAVRRFDPELIVRFADRPKQAVNWSPMAELLAEMNDPNWPN